MQQAPDIRQEAHKLIDQLPIEATWDDVVYRLVEKREIEAGLADSDANRVYSVEEVMKEFNIES